MSKWTSSVLAGTVLTALAFPPAWAQSDPISNRSIVPVSIPGAAIIVADATPAMPAAASSGPATVPEITPTHPAPGPDAGMAPNNSSAENATGPAPAQAANTTDLSQLSTRDRHFVVKAVEAGDAEIAEAQLALDKSDNADVKSFAQMIVDDHTKIGGKLQTIVSESSLPGDTASMDQQAVDKLKDLNGKRFDAAFLKTQVRAHRQAVALFRQEAKHGANPQLRQFATDTLPVLQHHQGMAKSLTEKL